MKKSTKKKAFTLTELLVVVIVVGVLAAVVLPKFSKVMETRKTTEAEELMAAVRTEQEKRCALDKNYLAKLADVQDILPSNNTKNFSYTLTSTGMEAQSKGKYGYTLKMPSYADGRICCESQEECAKLNKAYPLCTELIAMGDYQSGAECAGEAGEQQCSGSDTESRACGCNNGGTQTRTCDNSTGMWNDWNTCSISDACECKEEDKPEESQTCTSCEIGTQTRSVTCNQETGEWEAGPWGECNQTEEDCSEAGGETCQAYADAGRLVGYCAGFKGVPKNYAPGDKLSKDNCCDICEDFDTSCVFQSGKCILSGWVAGETGTAQAVKYNKNATTVSVGNMVAMGNCSWGACNNIEMLAQYGLKDQCNFAMSNSESVAIEDIQSSVDEQELNKSCSRCSGDSCNIKAFELGSSSWTTLFSSSSVGGDGFCALAFKNQTVGALSSNTSLSFNGNCGDETGGPGDLCWPRCGKDYSKFMPEISSDAQRKLEEECRKYKDIGKCKGGVFGIPSEAYESGGKMCFGMRPGVVYNSNCKVCATSSKVDIQAVDVKVWGCVKNDSAGQPCW